MAEDYFSPISAEDPIPEYDEPQDQAKPAAPQADFQLNPDWDIDTFVNEYSKYKGIKPRLIQSLRQQESSKGKNTYNKESKATGELQYLPSTAEKLGIDPTDPFESAAQTINDFSDRFKRWRSKSESDDHTWQRVIASHYTGETNVDKSIEEGKYLPETYNPKNAKDPTTPEYVAEIWERMSAEDKKEALAQGQAASGVTVKGIPEEAKAYEAIANASEKDAQAILKKMKPEERKAYDEWIAAQTAEAEAANPLAQKGIKYVPGKLVSTDNLDSINVPADAQGGVYQAPLNTPQAPVVQAGGNQIQYDQFLRTINDTYSKGKQTGDWSEYEATVRGTSFAPVVYTSQAQDDLGAQQELENAVRASARQISADEDEIEAMIAEWKSKGNGRIQIFNQETGQEMIPQPGMPFQVALSAAQAFRLNDHAKKVAADKTFEIENGVSGVGAYLMGLGSALRLKGMLQYGEGQVLRIFDEKLGSDWATFGYDPAQHQYYTAGINATDFGLIPGTPAFTRVQSRLEAGHMMGELTGEIGKMFVAHKAVGAVGKFLTPAFQRFVNPVVTTFAKAFPGFEMAAVGGNIATESALQLSAKTLTARVSQAMGTAAAWGGFNTLTSPESVKVDWDKATNTMNFERGIASTEIDAQGNPVFKKESWYDVGSRLTKEMQTLMLMSAFIYPAAGAVNAVVENPALKKFLKPLWVGVNAERGIERAAAEASLNSAITNPALLNAMTNALAAPVQSFVLHPELDWTKRLIDIAGNFAMGVVLHPGKVKNSFYAKHPETGEIYRFDTGDNGIRSEVVKTAPKGAEVYEPVSKDELNLYSMVMADRYGSPEQKQKIFGNVPDVPVPAELESQPEAPPVEAPVEEEQLDLSKASQQFLPFPKQPEAGQQELFPKVAEKPSDIYRPGEQNAREATENVIPRTEDNRVGAEAKPVTERASESQGSGEVGERRAGTPIPEVRESKPTAEAPEAQGRSATGEQAATDEVKQVGETAKPVEATVRDVVEEVERDIAPNPNATRSADQRAANKDAVVTRGQKKTAVVETATEEDPNFRPDLKGKKIKSGTDRYELTGVISERKGKKFAELVTPSGNKFPMPLDEVEKELNTPKTKKAPVEATTEEAPEYKDKTVVFDNKSYKLTGKTEKRGQVTFYQAIDAKGNEKLVPQAIAEKKKFFRIDTIFGEQPEQQHFRDRVRLALTRFNIDRTTSHFDVTELGKAHATEDNNLFLDPSSSHDLAVATIRAFADGSWDTMMSPNQVGAVTLKGADLKKLIPHLDNESLISEIKKLSDSEATVIDVYRSSRAIAHRHEGIHQALMPVKWKPETITALGATPEMQALRKALVDSNSSYGKVNDIDLADEAIAFGLTGDHKTLGVDRKTLAEAGAIALRQLAADNPDLPLATIKKLALQAGRDIVAQHKRDAKAAEAFGYNTPHEAAQARQEIVEDTNPEIIVDAHEQTPDEFNETYATLIPIQERAAILTDVGKEPFGIHGVKEVDPSGVYPITTPRGDEFPTGVYPIKPAESVAPAERERISESGEIIPLPSKPKPMSERKAQLLAYGNKVFYDASADTQELVVQAKGNPVRLNELVKKAGFNGYYSGDSNLPGGVQMNLFGEDLTTGKTPRKPRVKTDREPVQEHQLPLFTKQLETQAREIIAKDETLTPEEKENVNQVMKVLRQGATQPRKKAPGFKPKAEQRDLAADRIANAGQRAAKAYEGVEKAAARLKELRMMEDLPTTPPPKQKPIDEAEAQTLPFPEHPPENLLSFMSGFYEITPLEIQTRMERLKAIAEEQGLDISKRTKKTKEDGEEKQRMLFRIEEEVAADLLKAKQEKLFESGKTSTPKKRAAKKTAKGAVTTAQPSLDFEAKAVPEQLTPRQIAEKLRGFSKPSTAVEIPTIPPARESLTKIEEAPTPKSTSPMSAIEMLRAARAQAAQQEIKAPEPEAPAKSGGFSNLPSANPVGSLPQGNSIGDRIRRIADMVDSGATTNLADVLHNLANELTPKIELVKTPTIETFEAPEESKLERMKRIANSIAPKFRIEDNPEEFVKNSSYVIISGNKARSQSEAGLKATKELQKELQRKGFEFFQTTGKIKGNDEQSLLVPVKDKDEIDMLKGLGFKYKQNQVFVSHAGVYSAPYTDGITNRENFSRSSVVLTGDEARNSDSYTELHYDGGSIAFSVPDLFNSERASRITPKQQKIYDSIANEAKLANAKGFSARIAERTLGLPKENDLKSAFKRLDYLYSKRFPRKDDLQQGEQIARYVNDWTGTVRDILNNGLQEKQWYSDDIQKMYVTLGHDFPGIDASKSARLAFATMIATTSPRNSVVGNFEAAKDVFRRFLTSLGGSRDVVPYRTQEGNEYGVYSKGLVKLDKLYNGYVLNNETGKMEFNRNFRKQINKNGMQAIFDYLMSPGSKRAIVAQDMFGPKVGSFLSNLYGNTQIPTVDSWIVRSWRLNNGKMFNAKGELNDAVSEGLGNRIRGSIQSISARLNQEGYDVSPLEVQSLIWSHMKGMSDNLTGRKSIYKFSDAAQRSFGGKSIQLEQFWTDYGKSLTDSNPDIGEQEYITRAKSKSRVMFRNDESYIRDLRDDVFYSHLEKKVEEKLPKKFDVLTLKNFLASSGTGIKKDELEWSWVNEYLKGKKDTDKVSKDEFLYEVRTNRIKLYEFDSSQYDKTISAVKQYEESSFLIKQLEKLQKTVGTLTEGDQMRLENHYDYADVALKQIDTHYSEMNQKRIPQMEVPGFKTEKGEIARVSTLPGGENYRAVLFKAKGIVTADGHYHDGDSIASMRITDRFVDHVKHFLIEEIQSDHFQEARKKGFERSPAETEKIEERVSKLKEMADNLDVYRLMVRKREGEFQEYSQGDVYEKIEEINDYQASLMEEIDKLNVSQEGVQRAPLSETWHEAMMKRAVIEAARNGYDKVSLLSSKEHNRRAGFTGTAVSVEWDAHHGFALFGIHNGRFHSVRPENFDSLSDDPLTLKNIKNAVEASKESRGMVRFNAEVMLNAKKAKGMQKFYDDILPGYMKKLAKQFKSTFEEDEIQDGKGNYHKVYSLGIVPQMGERMPLFRDEQHNTNLLESDREASKKYEGYEVIEDAPGVNRYVVRGTDGTIIAAAQVANINSTRRITDFQVQPGQENQGAGAFLLQKIKGVESSASINNAASEIAYVSPKFRIQSPTNEDGWVDFGLSLKGSPLTPEEEAHVRKSFQTNPDEAQMLLAVAALRRSVPEFLLKVYKAGLLSGVGTTATNLLSNASMLALEEVSRIPAVFIDAAISKTMGTPRQMLGPSLEGIKEGLKGASTQGWDDFKEALRTGDFDNIYQIPVQAGIPILDNTIGTAADYVFRFMSAQDKLFKGYAFRRSMFEQAKLEEMNGGRKVADVMAAPSLEQVDASLRASAYATFQKDNFINDKFTEFKAWSEKNSKLVKWFLDLNLPFVKTGTNVAINGLEYLGVPAVAKAGHEAVKAIDMGSLAQTGKNLVAILQEPTTRQELTELSSRGLTGIALLFAGYKLASAGLLTADYDDKDKKEINSQAEKNAPFLSLQVGGRYITFQRLSPVGTFFAAGARMYADRDKSVSQNTWNVTKMLIKSFPVGKFAQGMETNKEALDYIVPRGNSVVPAIIRDFAKFGDVKRETRVQGDTFQEWWATRKNQFKSAIPGLRGSLEKQTTALGQTVDEGEPILGSTKARGSKLIDELTRVKWFPAHSVRDKNTQKFVDRPLELRQLITKNLEALVTSDEYSALPDDEAKQNWLQKATGMTIKEYEKSNPDADAQEKADAKKAKAAESKEANTTIRDILEKRQ